MSKAKLINNMVQEQSTSVTIIYLKESMKVDQVACGGTADRRKQLVPAVHLLPDCQASAVDYRSSLTCRLTFNRMHFRRGLANAGKNECACNCMVAWAFSSLIE
jgi:hypothetical protein